MKKLVFLVLVTLFFSVTSYADEDLGKYDIVYPFNDNGLAKVSIGEKWGVIDKEENFVVEPSFSFIGELSEGAIKFSADGFFGFTDSDFNIKILAKYKKAEDFSEGVSAVCNEDGKWGFIDKSGDLVVDFLYDEAFSFSGGLARVKAKDKYGYIDTAGKTVIDFRFIESYDFSCGFACAEADGKYGFIDKSGEFVIAPVYDAAWDFSESLAGVKKDGLWSFIDTKGKTVIEKNYDRATPFKNGLSSVRISGGKYGLIDKAGKAVSSFHYDYIDEFSDGLCRVRLDDKYGYINKSGLLVIPISFTRADNFSCGYAYAEKDSMAGYINKSGIFSLVGNFTDGTKSDGSLAGVRYADGLWGITHISSDKEETLPSDSPAHILPNNTNVIKLTIGSKDIFINGVKDTLLGAPIIENGRTLLPIRKIAEALGATVTWHAENQKVEIKSANKTIVLEIGKKIARIDGVPTPIDTMPKIIDDSTFLPVRFVTENLGADVNFNEKTSEILLYY